MSAESRGPRPTGSQAARPTLSLQEAEAVVGRRLALRHWRDKKLDLQRLEREPTTLRHVLSVARSAEIDAASACRDAGKVLDEVLLGDDR